MPSWVAHTDIGNGTGALVDPAAYTEEDWEYMVAHGNVVIAGSAQDPNILAARAAGVDYEDPRDQRIAELEAALLASSGVQSRPAGEQLQNLVPDEEVDEDADPENPVTDPDVLKAQQEFDAKQAKK
jgi:hypothetical protein